MKTQAPTPRAPSAEAIVNARGAARIRGGHPWVFRADVIRGPEQDASSGGPVFVTVREGPGRAALGVATWAARAKLALRMVTRGDEAPPRALSELVETRLDAALARRQQVEAHRNAFRVVHAEADGLPGLFVDRYADAVVVQTASVAMDAHRDAIADIVRRRLGARLVVARDDGSMRDFEGLPRFAGVIAGGGSTEVIYRLGQNDLAADLLTDGKTGGFLDQAENQAAIAALTPQGARCLDAFTYHGGFALALARRGGPVLATDEDPAAVARASANAARNGLANLEARAGNAFELLRDLEARRERFDVVVVDPPALIKRSGPGGGPDGFGARARAAGRDPALVAADRGYKELILRGARITAPGGLLVACSCSGRMTRAHFDELCAAAIADSGRAAQVVARNGAASDHPELVGVPETGHLKCWILRIL